MIRSAVLGVGAAALGALVIAVVYSAEDGVWTFLLLAGLAAIGLVAAHVAAAQRHQVGGPRKQVKLALAIAIAFLFVALAVGAALMFVSAHDALFVAVLAAFAGVVAARAAQLVAGGAMDDAESARRHLVAAVSHDLRTPITSLRLLAEAIGDDILDEDDRRRYSMQMITHLKALSGLIDDLFELSRLEAGEISWSMERVRVAELVGETVDAMRVQGEARNVTVRAELDPGALTARADPEQVQRVLFNLIQNAIRHTPADGSVVVRALPSASGVEIEVADTGEGISDEDRQKVFEPFFRGGSEQARTRTGAGLGLAIARAIVESHGGRIWLEEAKAGTRVRFSLPGG